MYITDSTIQTAVAILEANFKLGCFFEIEPVYAEPTLADNADVASALRLQVFLLRRNHRIPQHGPLHELAAFGQLSKSQQNLLNSLLTE